MLWHHFLKHIISRYPDFSDDQWFRGISLISPFKILKLELPYDSAIPFLGIFPKEMKAGSPRDICTPCS